MIIGNITLLRLSSIPLSILVPLCQDNSYHYTKITSEPTHFNSITRSHVPCPPQVDKIEADIKVEIGWCEQTESQIDHLLLQPPPKEKKTIEMNIQIYDVSIILCLRFATVLNKM